MCNDDSRGNQSPDRQDASPRTADHTDYRPILEALHTHTTNLLETVEDDPTLDPITRRRTRRRCHELRTTLERVRRRLPGATEPLGPKTTIEPPEEAVTVVRSPGDAALEAARRRARTDDVHAAEDDANRTHEDTHQPNEDDAHQPHDDAPHDRGGEDDD